MSLRDKQLTFSRYLGQLLTYAAQAAIPVAMGETWRSVEQAAWNAAHGTGIKDSLHTIRLAADLLCYRRNLDGTFDWLKDGTEPEYAQLGAYWKSLHPDCAWGGDFTPRPDPGHFSISHEGRR